MNLERARRQKSEQLELALEAKGEALHGQRSGEAPTAANGDGRSGSDQRLMEAVVERANAIAALKRVRQNRGSPGVDGRTVDDLPIYLAAEWEARWGGGFLKPEQFAGIVYEDLARAGGKR